MGSVVSPWHGSTRGPWHVPACPDLTAGRCAMHSPSLHDPECTKSDTSTPVLGSDLLPAAESNMAVQAPCMRRSLCWRWPPSVHRTPQPGPLPLSPMTVPCRLRNVVRPLWPETARVGCCCWQHTGSGTLEAWALCSNCHSRGRLVTTKAVGKSVGRCDVVRQDLLRRYPGRQGAPRSTQPQLGGTPDGRGHVGRRVVHSVCEAVPHV